LNKRGYHSGQWSMKFAHEIPPDFVVESSALSDSNHHRKMSGCGASRHFAATQQFSRFRREADIQQAALTELDL